MKPIDFPQKNFTFTTPESMTKEECGDLPVHVEVANNQPVITSCWELNAAEMEHIMQTGTIYLSVYATMLTPVSLSVIDPTIQGNITGLKDWEVYRSKASIMNRANELMMTLPEILHEPIRSQFNVKHLFGYAAQIPDNEEINIVEAFNDWSLTKEDTLFWSAIARAYKEKRLTEMFVKVVAHEQVVPSVAKYYRDYGNK